ncbi:MAG: hypothetical protein QM504_03285 [Pseudomonadota bacterium]
MQFQLYNKTFACDTEWKPSNEYNKADILEDLQVIDPEFYYVINMGAAGCQVSSYAGNLNEIKKPFYSMAALLISYLGSNDFVALVAVDNGAYYLKLERGLINASSDRLLEKAELMLFAESISEQQCDIFIDTKLTEYFPDNTDSNEFEDFEKGIINNFKKSGLKYIQLKGKASIAKNIFLVVILIPLLYLFLWMFDLLDYVGLGESKQEVTIVVGVSEEQKRLERRELMKQEVTRSLNVDTHKSLPLDFLNACNSISQKDVISVGGWKRVSSICKGKEFFSNFARTVGQATSANFESIALERYPERSITVNNGLAGLSTDVKSKYHKAVVRDYLPERPVLHTARSFYETRKDILLNVRLEDKKQKNLNIIYENVSYPVDADLNYSSAVLTMSKVPLYVILSIAETYNHEYAVIDAMTFIDEMVTAELTIYYR